MALKDPPLRVAQSSIRRFMRELRGKWVEANTNTPTPGYFFLPYRHAGEGLNLPLGWVGSRGCSWARQGGCTMCDYGGFSRTAAPDEIRNQVLTLIGAWGYPPIINLSSLGSVLDPQELDFDQRKAFFKVLGSIPSLKYVGVESRCEHVTQRALSEVVGWLRHVKLDIGVGLESHNEVIRNVILNKALGLQSYERAVQTMRDHGVLPVTHIYFKPPLLTERESVGDALRTIRYAITTGSKRTVLMLANIKRNTLPWWLHQRKLYRVPWLWSALSLLLSLADDELDGLFVYGFRCGMPLVDTARNCPKCTPEIELLLDQFNLTGQRAPLLKAWDLPCHCRSEWSRAFAEEPNGTLEGRIFDLVTLLKRGPVAS